MKRIRPVFLVAILAACGAPAGSRQAPDFSLHDLSGKTVSLSQQRGKPVLVNFWATWCDACKEETPALQRLHSRLGGTGLVILGVSMDEDAPKSVPPFARAYGLTFPLLISDRQAVADYQVRGLPTSYLIDADGRVVRRWVGPLDAQAVENDILALLKRRPS